MDIARRRILKTIGSGLLYWSLPQSGSTSIIANSHTDHSLFQYAWHTPSCRDLLNKQLGDQCPILLPESFTAWFNQLLIETHSDRQVYQLLLTYFGNLKGQTGYSLENAIYRDQYLNELYGKSMALLSPHIQDASELNHLFLGEDTHLYNKLFANLPSSGSSSALCVEYEPDRIQDMFCNDPFESPLVSHTHTEHPAIALSSPAEQTFDVVTAYERSQLFTGGYHHFVASLHQSLSKGGLLLTSLPLNMTESSSHAHWVYSQIHNAFNNVPWQQSLLDANSFLTSKNSSLNIETHNFSLMASDGHSLNLYVKTA